MDHDKRLLDKKDAYSEVDRLVNHKGLDYKQRTDMLKVKKSLYHQVRQLDKLIKR